MVTIKPFEAVYRVRFDEAGPDDMARASVLVRYAHDVAWRHSEHLGFDRDWYLARGLLWLVRTIDLDYRLAVPSGSDMVVDTNVTGYGRIWARRRSAAWVGEPVGEPAAIVLTDWVLVDASGRPTRMPSEFLDLFGSPPQAAEITKVSVDRSPPPGAGRLALSARRHELDPNGHVNNAVHLDWVDEAVREAARDGMSGAIATDGPRRYVIEYLSALALDERVDVSAWPADAGWSITIRRPDDSRELARARLTAGRWPTREVAG